jgi:hypothetical protein
MTVIGARMLATGRASTRPRQSSIYRSNFCAGTAASLRARSAKCLSIPASASVDSCLGGSDLDPPFGTTLARGSLRETARCLLRGDQFPEAALRGNPDLGRSHLELAILGLPGIRRSAAAKNCSLEDTCAHSEAEPAVGHRLDLKAPFEREARTLATLSYLHICSVFEVGRIAGT